jgi:hypothetical protein
MPIYYDDIGKAPRISILLALGARRDSDIIGEYHGLLTTPADCRQQK